MSASSPVKNVLSSFMENLKSPFKNFTTVKKSQLIQKHIAVRFLSETNHKTANVHRDSCAVSGKNHCQRGYIYNFLCNTNSEEFFGLGYLDSLFSQTIFVTPLTNAITHTTDVNVCSAIFNLTNTRPLKHITSQCVFL